MPSLPTKTNQIRGCMGNRSYYAIAALLVLASFPMYRYILSSTIETAAPERMATSETSSSKPAGMALSAAQLRRLLAGEICREGLVYLATEHGYQKATSGHGGVVRCQGAHLMTAWNGVGNPSTAAEKTWYAYGEELPDGYKCAAADGPVYRTRIESGVTVIEPLVRGGIIVRCGGDDRSIHYRSPAPR